MKQIITILTIVMLMNGCGTFEKYTRLQASQIDGELSGGPVSGTIHAKDLLIITAPGRGKEGVDVYEISPKFYDNIPDVKKEGD